MKYLIFVSVVILGLAFAVNTSAQIDLSALTSLGYTGLDTEDGINKMHRNDNPFNPLRATVFMESWIDDDVGFFLEFLWDSGDPPTGGSTKPRVNGAYAVISPFETDALNFKFGLIPSVFGTWAPRTYADKNPLIGVPLMQHYFVSHSGNHLFATTDEMRDSLDDESDDFMSVAYDACWPYGVEAFGFFSKYEYALAVTKDTMSNPMSFGNDGAQVMGRFGVRPLIGMRLGISAEYGSYLREGSTGLPDGTSLESVAQKAVGFDIHYSRAHTNIFSEVVLNWWENPNLNKDMGCTVWYVEAKQKLMPGFYAAIRFDQMLFNEFTDSGGKSFNWDNDVTRIEAGLGYHLSRNTLAKVVWQHNEIQNRDDIDLLSIQFIFTMKP
ncbi:hypothetical protein ACFL47_08805 [Candidatus Latescibacterota bacterium]